MKIEVLDDADEVAEEAAAIIATDARIAVAERGRFVLAVSGGHTPWAMLRDLAGKEVPWPGVHVLQVDERVAPAGDPDRNLTHLRESLLEHAPLAPGRFTQCRSRQPIWNPRQRDTQERCARLPVHRPCSIWCISGLGPDGHTASLVPTIRCLR